MRLPARSALLLCVGTLATIGGMDARRLLAQDQRGEPTTYISAYPYANGTARPAAYVSAYPSSDSQVNNPSNDDPRFYAPVSGPARPSFTPSAYAPPQAAVYATAYGPASVPAAPYGPGDAANCMAPPPYGPPSFAAPGNGDFPMQAGGAPPCCETPRWTITAGAEFLHRAHSSAPSLPLVEDFLTGDVVLSSGDVDSAWGGGPRIDGIAHFGDEWDVELLYFGINNFHGSASVAGAGLYAPSLSDSVVFTEATADSKSSLNSGEANLLQPLTSQLNLLLGLRFLDMTDELSLSATGQAGGATESAKLNNMLSGFQVGGTLALEPTGGPMRLESFVKAGVFLNEITRHETGSGVSGEYVYDDSFKTRPLSARRASRPTTSFPTTSASSAATRPCGCKAWRRPRNRSTRSCPSTPTVSSSIKGAGRIVGRLVGRGR